MTLASMTGFTDRRGGADGFTWVWDARSVNGRGLDLRLRLAEGVEWLEAPLRRAVGQALTRGSFTITLRLARGEAGRTLRVSEEALRAAVEAARAAEDAAAAAGLALAPSSAADLLGLRGVLEADGEAWTERETVRAALAQDIEPLVADLAAARAAEGAALAAILMERLAAIAGLAAVAREMAETRAARSGALLRERVAALLEAGAPAEEGRLAQELALLAVKSDVTEELDRLEAHVAAARALVLQGGAVGRRLDFLMQEFNREANTLAAKAQSTELTTTALELKVVIDQVREQVQNVE